MMVIMETERRDCLHKSLQKLRRESLDDKTYGGLFFEMPKEQQ